MLFKKEYGLWDIDDERNIESLVIEMRTSKELDNGKLLLDVLPRSALGYEFDIETVRYTMLYCDFKCNCMINHYVLFLTISDRRFI